MKHFYTILILVLLNQNPTQAEPVNSAFSLISAKQRESLILESQSRFKRENAALIIPLKNGKKAIFKNTEQTQYSLVDIFHPNFALLAISANPPHLALVSLNSGARTIVYSKPVFSPDYRYLIDTSLDLEISDYYNQIRVFQIKQNELELIWKHRYEGWDKGPSSPVWASNQKFYYFETTIGADANDEPHYEKTPKTVTFINDSWQLVQPEKIIDKAK